MSQAGMKLIGVRAQTGSLRESVPSRWMSPRGTVRTRRVRASANGVPSRKRTPFAFFGIPSTQPSRGGRESAGAADAPLAFGRCLVGAAVAVLAVVVTALPVAAQSEDAPDQPSTQPSPRSAALPDSDAPLAEPVVAADATFDARNATAWPGDQQRVRYLRLSDEVRFEMGLYGFQAERAVVRIVTEPRPGKPVRHLSLYLDEARPLHDHGAVTAKGERILITAATTGTLGLNTDLLEQADQPPGGAFVRSGLDRIRQRDRRLAQRTLPAPDQPLYGPDAWQRRAERRRQIDLPTVARGPASATQPAQPVQPETPDAPERADQPAPRPAEQPPATAPAPQVAATEPAEPAQPAATRPAPTAGILPTAGTVRFNADRVVYERGEAESSLLLIGDVRLFYEDRANNRQVTLKTERAVLFLAGTRDETSVGQRVEAGQVRGVYLEDNAVISNGDFTVRAPRMYYDLRLNRAILLEAVMYTYDVRRDIPLYMRADVVRQTSRRSFEAQRALMTTSAFAEPHFAIGAQRLTLKQRETEDGETRQQFTASHTTLEAGGVPVFYWPYMAGDSRDVPLQSVSVGHSSDNGMQVETAWDVFALAGREAPDGVEASVKADYRGDHGPATGLEVSYDTDQMRGEADSYFLPDDNGTDEISNRRDIEHDSDTRGFLRWQHRQTLQDDWLLQLEGAYVSDETFLDEFFEDETVETKPYETSLYLKKQQDDWQLDLLAKTSLTDFTPQLTQLQTPGYDVSKAPELGYYRIGTNLLDNRLTWYSENRISRVRADFGDETPDDRGFSDSQSRTLFGFDEDVSFEDNAGNIGFPTDWRTRLDSRQELTAPMAAGPFDITPYVSGRFTAYDDDFESFNGNDDQYRLQGSAGTRVTTQFHRTYDADSRLLNLRGLRHIIEPEADLFYVGSTLDSADLPVYDAEVEGITEGAGLRLGLTNTLETQRGGPGRWRSVDWITLETDLVLRSDDVQTSREIGHFFGYRPEFSLGGDHFYSRVMWMVTDSLGVSGDITYNLESNETARWRLGARLDHTPRLNTFLEYSHLEIFNSQLLRYGLSYQLTRKYRIGFAQTMDFGENESRDFNVAVHRDLPQWRVSVIASVDEIDQEQTIALVFRPRGASQTGFGSGLLDRGN